MQTPIIIFLSCRNRQLVDFGNFCFISFLLFVSFHLSPSFFPGSILDTFQYLRLLVGGKQIGHFTCGHIMEMLIIIVLTLIVMINAEGGTSCENHADVFQESLVFYLEVGEEKDNLTEEEQSKKYDNEQVEDLEKGRAAF